MYGLASEGKKNVDFKALSVHPLDALSLSHTEQFLMRGCQK